ncbi:MAG: acyl-CoA thioesterase [Desulfuromonadales bacterium]|jgi:acyl-CoA thioester hydrolase|nr:acyl-CoA thioesterase [Desulfuromonadales bacterium]
MKQHCYALELLVRDYECDLQGIVNNAVYQNYLEHARHEYLKSQGIDFAELARAQINLVVLRAELDYRQSLRSGDRLLVTVQLARASRLRFTFCQEIYRLPDKAIVLQGKITGTALGANGRPCLPERVSALLEQVKSRSL